MDCNGGMHANEMNDACGSVCSAGVLFRRYVVLLTDGALLARRSANQGSHF